VDVVCLMAVSSWGLWVRQFSEQIKPNLIALVGCFHTHLVCVVYLHLDALNQWLICYQVALTKEKRKGLSFNLF
jgi:hypothetical protein